MSFRYSKEYDSIAKRQAPIYLGHNRDVFQDEMSKLIATFDKEPVQAFLSDKRQPANLIGADRTCCVVCRQPNAKNRYRRGGMTKVVCPITTYVVDVSAVYNYLKSSYLTGHVTLVCNHQPQSRFSFLVLFSLSSYRQNSTS